MLANTLDRVEGARAEIDRAWWAGETLDPENEHGCTSTLEQFRGYVLLAQLALRSIAEDLVTTLDTLEERGAHAAPAKAVTT